MTNPLRDPYMMPTDVSLLQGGQYVGEV